MISCIISACKIQFEFIQQASNVCNSTHLELLYCPTCIKVPLDLPVAELPLKHVQCDKGEIKPPTLGLLTVAFYSLQLSLLSDYFLELNQHRGIVDRAASYELFQDCF